MVFGETPYAEGFGDIKNLNFSKQNINNIQLMKKFTKEGIKVISLFITGRPLIVDEEINISDAFVTIWQPGTSVEGINDVIFSNLDNSVNHDFKGKLPYSWPSVSSSNPLNYGDQNYQPKYEYGFGLSYK